MDEFGSNEKVNSSLSDPLNTNPSPPVVVEDDEKERAEVKKEDIVRLEKYKLENIKVCKINYIIIVINKAWLCFIDSNIHTNNYHFLVNLTILNYFMVRIIFLYILIINCENVKL